MKAGGGGGGGVHDVRCGTPYPRAMRAADHPKDRPSVLRRAFRQCARAGERGGAFRGRAGPRHGRTPLRWPGEMIRGSPRSPMARQRPRWRTTDGSRVHCESGQHTTTRRFDGRRAGAVPEPPRPPRLRTPQKFWRRRPTTSLRWPAGHRPLRSVVRGSGARSGRRRGALVCVALDQDRGGHVPHAVHALRGQRERGVPQLPGGVGVVQGRVRGVVPPVLWGAGGMWSRSCTPCLPVLPLSPVGLCNNKSAGGGVYKGTGMGAPNPVQPQVHLQVMSDMCSALGVGGWGAGAGGGGGGGLAQSLGGWLC